MLASVMNLRSVSSGTSRASRSRPTGCVSLLRRIESDSYYFFKQFNNTLASYKTCLNANDPLKADRRRVKVAQWAGMYLACAVGRLQPLTKGYELRVEDVYVLQQLCAYEVCCVSHRVSLVVCTPAFFTGFLLDVDCDSRANTPHTDRRAGIFQVLRAVHRGGVGWVRLFP
jgi:hypothetical protein